MHVVDINTEAATKFFMLDPKLAYLGLGDEEMHLLAKTGEYDVSGGASVFKGVEHNQELVCIFKYEWFTTHCVNLHMYIASKYHKSELVREVAKVIRGYFEGHPWIIKVILLVPSSCEHIHAFAPKYGFVKEGCITKCYQWRQQYIDLVIYGISLDKKEEL